MQANLADAQNSQLEARATENQLAQRQKNSARIKPEHKKHWKHQGSKNTHTLTGNAAFSGNQTRPNFHKEDEGGLEQCLKNGKICGMIFSTNIQVPCQ